MDELNNKTCSLCKEEFPATNEYFYTDKNNKSGLYAYCKECTKKKSHQYQLDHPEKRRIYQKRADMKPKKQQQMRESNRKLRERGDYRKWQQNNKDKIKEYNDKRKHKNHAISKKEWEVCKEYFNYSCAYCGLHMSDHIGTYKGQKKLRDLHKEHVEHEGSNKLDNCIPACKSCNSEKHEKTLEEWYNKNNDKFDEERLDRIHNWLNGDYRLFIKGGQV